jgi:hypothetical protein
MKASTKHHYGDSVSMVTNMGGNKKYIQHFNRETWKEKNHYET